MHSFIAHAASVEAYHEGEAMAVSPVQLYHQGEHGVLNLLIPE